MAADNVGTLSSDAPASAAVPAGLTNTEAHRRLIQFGPNAVIEVGPSRWRVFVSKFWTPVPWMLEAAIVLQLGLGRNIEAMVIGGLLIFNATLGYLQEGRANAAIAALKKRLAPTTLVRRDGNWLKCPASELVPGDVIRLMLGALVPADARLVSGWAMVDQSMLTGESVPVEADVGSQVYASSLVRRGEAIAEVTATGPNSYFGRAAELVRVARAASTEQAAVFGTTRNLAVVNGTVAILIVSYALSAGWSSGDLINLALTVLLASIPVALPATFTLSAAISAQIFARHGILLTRLSAAHEAAAIDVLCSDKTGTLTRNALAIDEVCAMPGFDRERVLALASLASSESDQDPIDATIRRGAGTPRMEGAAERLVRFVPFDPSTKVSEAFAVDQDGNALRIVKGAFQAIEQMAEVPADSRQQANALADRGHRIIAVAAGPSASLRAIGIIALSDPPRDDSAALIASLREMNVRTVMVTGDSAATAVAIARKVGIPDRVCPSGRFSDELSGDEYGVFARVVPEEKYRLVKALQRAGHIVGMCGDGANDAPALRQAQVGIAVSSATDVAKASAGMVLTEPGLAGIVFAVREGRIAFQRLLTYTFNMLIKKIEIVLLLAIGLGLTGHAILTPVLMVLLLVTNDFLSMSLTTDHASPAPSPSVWRMGNITVAAIMLAACKLGFSTAVLAFGRFRLGLDLHALPTLAFVTIVFGNQAVLFALRERRRMWYSRPSAWVIASSATDVAIASILVMSGTLMEPLSGYIVLAVFVAAAGFALVIDLIKMRIISSIKVE